MDQIQIEIGVVFKQNFRNFRNITCTLQNSNFDNNRGLLQKLKKEETILELIKIYLLYMLQKKGNFLSL